MRTVDTERRAAARGAVAGDAVRPGRPGPAGPAGSAARPGPGRAPAGRGTGGPRPGGELSAQARAERGTRARVARLILELGPSTASVIGGRLGLTPAAIRRHLDNLLAEGLIETRTARTYASRGRGRPARLFAITDAGRSAFEHTYDDLASSALRFLAEEAGPAAVEKFARHQVSELERRYGAVLAGVAPADRVRALADALSADGYAASADAAPGTTGPRALPRCWAASSCASTTARWRTSPRSSRSSARRKPSLSAGCWAAPCSGWLRSPTATASAPRTSPAAPWLTARA